MGKEPDGQRQSHRFDPPWSDISGRKMGELEIGEEYWDVVLETAPDPADGVIRGRIHFIAGNTHRLSAWMFLEWDERDIDARFREFSTGRNLWDLLQSLQ